MRAKDGLMMMRAHHILFGFILVHCFGCVFFFCCHFCFMASHLAMGYTHSLQASMRTIHFVNRIVFLFVSFACNRDCCLDREFRNRVHIDINWLSCGRFGVYLAGWCWSASFFIHMQWQKQFAFFLFGCDHKINTTRSSLKVTHRNWKLI